ncbi:hypothetical protein B0H14DRAFT_3464144 [Mycena olivaceomarginata]|nr:hypothetical protein B0H14DRAFT_3464144 [Mycena olivaceomarginata]
MADATATFKNIAELVLLQCLFPHRRLDIWRRRDETYVSALLRAILYSDDPTHALDVYRKLDPMTSPKGELRFLAAAEALFLKGWHVGSDPEI